MRSGSHGAPLGQEEIEAAKLALGWNDKPDFHVPDEVREVFAERKKELKLQHQQWEEKLAGWKQSDPEQAKLWDSHWEKKLPDDLLNQLIDSISGEEDATRNLSGKISGRIFLSGNRINQLIEQVIRKLFFPVTIP